MEKTIVSYDLKKDKIGQTDCRPHLLPSGSVCEHHICPDQKPHLKTKTRLCHEGSGKRSFRHRTRHVLIIEIHKRTLTHQEQRRSERI